MLQRLQRAVSPILINHLAPSVLIRATWRLAPRSEGPLWVEGEWGRFLVDPTRRPLDSAMYYHGVHEAGTARFIETHVNPGDIVFDCGAYIGFQSIHAARLGAVVHAFEPDPETAGVLRENVAANGVDVTVHQVAIGATDGKGPLYLADNPAGNTMDHVGGETTTVTVRSIDSLAAELGAPRLVKLDVEGWELEALAGASETLTRHRPFLIVESSRIGVSGRRTGLPNLEGYEPGLKIRRGKDARSDNLVPVRRLPRHDNIFYIPQAAP